MECGFCACRHSIHRLCGNWPDEYEDQERAVTAVARALGGAVEIRGAREYLIFRYGWVHVWRLDDLIGWRAAALGQQYPPVHSTDPTLTPTPALTVTPTVDSLGRSG